MPRPCAVELHARNYKIRHQSFADATALCRGASRSQLQTTSSEFCGCHAPVPWSFTLAATKYVVRVLRMPLPCAVELHARNYKPRHQSFANATPLCRGASRSQLQNTSSEFCGCHCPVPWSFTLATTNHVIRVLRMPR